MPPSIQNVVRLFRLYNHCMEVLRGELLFKLHFHLPDEGRKNDAELQVRELLSNATMPAGTEGLVRGFGTLANGTKSVVDLRQEDGNEA